jgi:hypothetical protein
LVCVPKEHVHGVEARALDETDPTSDGHAVVDSAGIARTQELGMIVA